jgi:exopolysaccharide biosynthesis predicted pyruvyltransferase EpsI
VSLPGNNGDRLIETASRLALSGAGLSIAPRPEGAAVIVLNGGGALGGSFRGLETLTSIASRYPATPLVVLPSLFEAADRALLAALEARRAPSVLFAREEGSLRNLEAAGFDRVAEIGLDHDMAFSLRDSGFLKDLLAHASARHVLIVERTDQEAFTGRREVLSVLEREQPAWIRAAIPTPVRRSVRETFAHIRRLAFRAGALRDASTPFARDARELIARDLPELTGLPVIAADISQTSLCSFETFCRLIADAAAVATTRLHVGILAGLLGKPAYLAPGPGFKVSGVYAYSMREMPGVHLWDWDQRRSPASL